VDLDCDALDPSIVPGVIGRSPGGLTYWNVVELLHGIAGKAKLSGFNLVEFMPDSDVDEIGALNNARIICNVLGLSCPTKLGINSNHEAASHWTHLVPGACQMGRLGSTCGTDSLELRKQIASCRCLSCTLPPDANNHEAISRLDGLVMAGGADIEPARYGAAHQEGTDKPRVERDASELGLYRAAREANIPVFGICRGLQIMAVAHGGSLHQHLPDVVGNTLHRDAPGTFNDHGATFTLAV
jgi:hypothetical protein